MTRRTAAPPLVAIYADESCLGNGREGDNPGGAGGLVEYERPENGEIVRRDFWVSERATTNNRMALRSVIDGFRALSAKRYRLSVVFTSDSRYLVDGMTDWVFSWVRRGWKKSDGKPVENIELWRAAIAAVGEHEVHWRWVRGHRGHPQNEYANHLATLAAAEQTSSDGLAESHFDEWLALERSKNRCTGAPDPFPAAGQFVPSRTLPDLAAARPS